MPHTVERKERNVKQQFKYRGFDSETPARDKSCVKTKDNANPSSFGLQMPGISCKDSLTFRLGGRAVYKYTLKSIPIPIVV